MNIFKKLRNLFHPTKSLILFRGIPGAGKSTISDTLCDVTLSADMFFEKDGEYKFEYSKLKDAHNWCQDSTVKHMKKGTRTIGVANTFVQPWSMDFYFNKAKEHGYRIFTVIVENRNDTVNVHNVNEEVLETMRSKFDVKL